MGFVLVAGWLSTELPAWSEGRSVYPVRAAGRSLVLRDGRVAAEPSCATTAGWTLRSGDRPHWVLCVGDFALPLMITPYASGVVYWPSLLLWPLHQGDLRWLRLCGLLLGAAAILLTARLAERLAGRELGTLSTLLLAVTSPLLVLSGILAHYELTPWFFLAAAGLAWRPSSSRLRAAACGFLVGLALGANIKALFLAVPLGALAWRLRPGWLGQLSRVPRALPTAVFAVVASLLALTPNLAHLVVDGAQGFEGQVAQRLAALAQNLYPRRFGEELVNLGWFWGDMMMYFDAAAGRRPEPSLPALAVVWPCLLYCLGSAARVWWRGKAEDGLGVIAAGCGTLLATFVAVSALLYDQFPAANHSPLYAVFGLATAATLARAMRALRSRIGSWRWALAALAAAALLHATLRRGPPTRYLEIPVDLAAEAEIASFLRHRPDHGSRRTLSATYNYAGVFDGLGAAPVDRAHRVLAEASAGPLVTRVRALLAYEPGSFDLIVPARAVPIDEPFVAELSSTLSDEARAASREVQVVHESRGRGESVLIRVWRVAAAPPRTP